MTDFKAKMHQIRFGAFCAVSWGSLQRSPDPLAGFGGRFTAGGGAGPGKRRERGGRGSGGPSYCWTRAPQSLATPLLEQFVCRRQSRRRRHCLLQMTPDADLV